MNKYGLDSGAKYMNKTVHHLHVHTRGAPAKFWLELIARACANTHTQMLSLLYVFKSESNLASRGWFICDRSASVLMGFLWVGVAGRDTGMATVLPRTNVSRTNNKYMSMVLLITPRIKQVQMSHWGKGMYVSPRHLLLGPNDRDNKAHVVPLHYISRSPSPQTSTRRWHDINRSPS